MNKVKHIEYVACKFVTGRNRQYNVRRKMVNTIIHVIIKGKAAGQGRVVLEMQQQHRRLIPLDFILMCSNHGFLSSRRARIQAHVNGCSQRNRRLKSVHKKCTPLTSLHIPVPLDMFLFCYGTHKKNNLELKW